MSELLGLCKDKLKEKNLDTETYNKRLEHEIQNLQNSVEKHNYFLDLYAKKIKYPNNEHNLLIVYLLDICKDFNIDKKPKRTEFIAPDVDLDFISEARDYLKNDFIPEKYGKDYVCNISSHTTFGLKSLLLDLTKLFGEDRKDILSITTKMKMKDEDGDVLSLEEAMKIYPALKEWGEKNPKIIDAVQNMLYSRDINWEKYDYKNEPPHKTRGIGLHAGGCIISSEVIKDTVPLVRTKRGIASAWTEGQHDQELSPVGFVKIDTLVLDTLKKIAETIRLIYQRHNLDTICTLPDSDECWSDLAYLNDPHCLDFANRGDLNMVFQFDSEGIRQLSKKGGVESFNDLVAYTSIFRPACLSEKMDELYCKRKKGLEKYEIHPVLEPILNKTYGILLYQEDIMRVLQTVGLINLDSTMEAIKAISKKNLGKMKKYEEQFITNGQKTLNQSREELQGLFNLIKSFAGYGFNKSLDSNTLIPTTSGQKSIKNIKTGDVVYSINEFNTKVESIVLNLYDHGTLDGYQITFDDNYSVICTLNHKFLTRKGQQPLWKIIKNKLYVLCDGNMSRKVMKISYVGKRQMYDIEVSCPTHNFILPTGVITSNSHAVEYSMLSARTLYLKVHYPIETYCAFTGTLDTGDDRIQIYRRDAQRHNIIFEPIDLNLSDINFKIINEKIYYGFSKIKGIGEEVSKRIVEFQPYKDFEDFITKFGDNMSVIKPLLALRVFGEDPVTLFKYYLTRKNIQKKHDSSKVRFERNLKVHLNTLKTLSGEQLSKYQDKYEKFINNFKNKNFLQLSLKDFDVNNIDDSVKKELLKHSAYLKILKNKYESEVFYYGFRWRHILQDCENAGVNTFEQFRIDDLNSGPVDIVINKVEQKTSQKNTKYCQLTVEDSNEEKNKINVWINDYERFKEFFVVGATLRMQLMAPTNGFPTYSLKSYPRYAKLPPLEQDYRITPLKRIKND